jgi:hypothetical protein
MSVAALFFAPSARNQAGSEGGGSFSLSQ